MDTILEQRLARLEAMVAQLQNRSKGDLDRPNKIGTNDIEGIKQMVGRFANEPLFEEMIRYCEAQRETEQQEAELEA